MTNEACTIESNAKIQDAARMMSDKKIGSLIVVNEDKPIGIITEQDLARKVVATGLSPEQTVSMIMSNRLHSIHPKRDIHEAMVLMGKKGVKHLPVISNRLEGIISFKDVIAIHPDLIELLTFKSSMSK